jgi:hypothetical protein
LKRNIFFLCAVSLAFLRDQMSLPLDRWASGQRYHHAVFGLVLRPTGTSGQSSVAPVIRDNASWHYSELVRTWLREHNQQVKDAGKGVHILPLFLPKKSPWLNPIEPKWMHSKRDVVAPNGLLSSRQLAERIRAYYRCSYEAHLSIPEKVS